MDSVSFGVLPGIPLSIPITGNFLVIPEGVFAGIRPHISGRSSPGLSSGFLMQYLQRLLQESLDDSQEQD